MFKIWGDKGGFCEFRHDIVQNKHHIIFLHRYEQVYNRGPGTAEKNSNKLYS